MKIINLVLINILICGIIIGCGRRDESVKEEKEIIGAGKADEGRQIAKVEEVKEEFLPKAKYGRDDPFSPITGKREIIEDKTGLQGISWDEEQPLAIIDGVIVGVGDRVSGREVVKIEKDRVILDDGEKYFELRLKR